METDHITLLTGARQGERVLIDSSLVIGRNPDSGLYLDDPQVSRKHAMLERAPDGIWLKDLKSGNGTFVGDRRIIEHRLQNGEVIRIGNVQMRFEQSQPSSHNVLFSADVAGQMEAASAANLYQTFFQASTVGTGQQQRDAQQRLAAVYKANQIISSERNLRRLFERVLDEIFTLVPAHNGVIVLKDEKSGDLVTECVKSNSGGATVISSTIVGRALDHGEAVITFDAAGDERFGAGMSIISHNIASAMCAPLMHQDQPLGAVYVDTHGATHAFSKSDLELLVAVAGPAGIAIRNAQYVHQLERAYHDTLIVLANAIEMRDHYTVGHTWRVTHFALEIARAMGWSKEKLEECETGGLLHDVGKIAVDDAILRKAARLDEDEFSRMKVHPERGARMLSDVEFLKPMIPYCLYHHERYDGKGYPFGLAGEDIPIEGRLISVADTFDAMTSNRPYRKGLDPEFAVQEILNNAGTQFDPLVARMLAHCYKEGKITRIIQESQKDGRSIVCPFCSTYISVPDEANIGDQFQCQVCRRHVQLQMKNDALFGMLLSETE